MTFFAPLVVDGALAGAIYALIALAFVLVYKASRMINFALGEWVMLAARVVASGFHSLGLSVVGAIGLGLAGMVALALVFNRWVVEALVGRPLIALVMVTIGLGIFMRGVASTAFRDVPARIPLAIPADPPTILGMHVPPEKLIAAAVAAICIAAVSWFFRATRTGLALRAIADDQQTALAVGIDVQRHLGLTWAMAGALTVFAGTL